MFRREEKQVDIEVVTSPLENGQVGVRVVSTIPLDGDTEGRRIEAAVVIVKGDPQAKNWVVPMKYSGNQSARSLGEAVEIAKHEVEREAKSELANRKAELALTRRKELQRAEVTAWFNRNRP